VSDDGGQSLFRVEIAPAAQRDMRGLPKDVVRRLDPHIRGLSADPYPGNSIRLVNEGGLHRMRIGNYRVLYEVDEASRVVRIARVKHWKDAYR
jgi:mRNA interferase RelE/StbE